MKRPLRILFITSELSPLVSTGGLAEVAAALPRALHAQGQDVRVAMPCYRQIPAEHQGGAPRLCVAQLGNKTEYGALRTGRVPGTDIPLYLVEHEGYFGREAPYGVGAYEYDDNAERFCFFCLALMDGLAQSGWRPDIVHCHDWHTAPIPVYLKTRFRTNPFWGGAASLFTIHNLAYQGRYDAAHFKATGFSPELFSSDFLEYEGDMNLMKGALVFADAITTVSPRYAREIQTVEYGSGLHGVLAARRADLHGILNGVDYAVWNPSADKQIATRFDKDHLEGKSRCKAALQDLFGLPQSDAPLFGIVSRLHWQKGIDLVADALEDLMGLDLQMVVLGTGDPGLEARMGDAAARWPDRFAVYLGFDAARAHAVQAGSDFFLMPSRYEPCGLGQLYAMAYGTVPVVRRTGGLADTVAPYRPLLGTVDGATGFSFIPLTRQALTRCMRAAVEVYGDKALLARLRDNGMAQDYSWDRSSRAYIDLYQSVLERRAAHG